MARKQWEQGQPKGKSGILSAIHDAGSESQKWKLIKEFIIEPGTDGITTNYDVFIGRLTQIHHSESREPFDWEDKAPLLQEYITGAPVDGYLPRAAKQLANYHKQSSDYIQAQQVLEQTEQRLNDYRNQNQRNELTLERAKLYVEEEQYEQASQVIQELLRKLNPNEAYLQDQLTILSAQVTNKMENSDSDPLNSTVTGTVKRGDGTPLANVGVFLRDSSIVNQSISERDPYQTTTDKEGKYKFKDVAPGSYQLNIGVRFEQISGWTWPVGYDDWIDISGSLKVNKDVIFRPLLELVSPVNHDSINGSVIDFQWKPVADASYYTVNAGIEYKNGSTSIPVRNYVTGNRLQISVDQLYDVKTGLTFGMSGDWSSVDHSSILGFTNPDGEFFWSVDAYDAEGKLLTRSSGYRLSDSSFGNLPFFKMPQHKLTAGDQLVRSGQIPEALAEYTRVYDNNPDELHALRMIIRLLQSKESITGKKEQPSEVVPYLEKMVKLQPATESYLYDLAHYAYEQKDWDTFNKWFEQYVRVLSEPMSDYVQSIYATALLKQGKAAEAEQQFQQALAQDKSHRFVGNYLASMLLNQHSFDAVLSAAERYPERSYGLRATAWAHSIKQMISESKGSTAYSEELRTRIQMYITGKEDLLTQWIPASDHYYMKEFIRALYKIN
jgi:tetratricopeptide (TPR) repeat protein